MGGGLRIGAGAERGVRYGRMRVELNEGWLVKELNHG